MICMEYSDINNNSIPDLFLDNNMLANNPSIFAPDAPYAISMLQTSESLLGDSELFSNFVHNVVSQFRHMRVYKNYKTYLYNIGLNRCQFLPQIDADMADLEMHHTGITIFDVAVIITHHYLATRGKVCTFDVISSLRELHILNKLPITMLSKTVHQLYHNTDDFLIPVDMCFGFWIEFLEEYRYGITYGIANKIVDWITESVRIRATPEEAEKLNSKLLGIRKYVQDWSAYNEYTINTNINNRLIDVNYNRNRI